MSWKKSCKVMILSGYIKVIWLISVSYTHLDVYKRQGHANVVFAVDEANNSFKTKDPAQDNDVIFNYSTITSTSQSQRWDATIKIN